MARAEPVKMSRYFEEMRKERVQAENLLEQRQKAVMALQTVWEEKAALLSRQEEQLQAKEASIKTREEALEIQKKEIEARSAAFGPAYGQWEREKQQLIEESRRTADHFQSLLQMEKQKNAELSRTMQEQKTIIENLRVEKTKLMKMIM